MLMLGAVGAYAQNLPTLGIQVNTGNNHVQLDPLFLPVGLAPTLSVSSDCRLCFAQLLCEWLRLRT